MVNDYFLKYCQKKKEIFESTDFSINEENEQFLKNEFDQRIIKLESYYLNKKLTIKNMFKLQKSKYFRELEEVRMILTNFKDFLQNSMRFLARKIYQKKNRLFSDQFIDCLKDYSEKLFDKIEFHEKQS